MAAPVTEASTWDDAAKVYLSIVSKITGYMAEKALNHHSHLWSGHGDTPIRFLDVAAGPGLFSKILARKLSQSAAPYSISCTDFADGMLDLARKEIDDPNVKIFQMDGEDMGSIQGSTMDGVNCLFGIMFMPQYQRSLVEMRRVLKKGGKATVGTWFKAGTIDLADAFGVFLGAMELGDVSPERKKIRVGADPDELVGVLQRAGFSEVKVVRESYDLVLEDVTPMYANLVGNQVSRMSLYTGKENAREPSRELFDQFLEQSPLAGPFKRPGGYGIEMICNLAVATA